jgi:hypothetical protein
MKEGRADMDKDYDDDAPTHVEAGQLRGAMGSAEYDRVYGGYGGHLVHDGDDFRPAAPQCEHWNVRGHTLKAG